MKKRTVFLVVEMEAILTMATLKRLTAHQLKKLGTVRQVMSASVDATRKAKSK